MKKMICSFLFLALSYQAHSATYTEGTQFEAYKSAIVIALGYNKVCNVGGGSWDIDVLVKSAKEVIVTDGQQPLITVNTYPKNQNIDLVQITISTSEDYQKIQKIDIREFKYAKVNKGTLLNPDIIDDYIYFRTCK